MSRSVEYRAYHDAKQRCNNPNHKRYSDWGGRGIKFLFHSYQQFIDHIGPRPDNYSIDRINNNGNYEIGNVRWSTRVRQQLNKRVAGVREVKATGLITKTWQSYITINGQFYQLYTGPNYSDAVQAREDKINELNASNI